MKRLAGALVLFLGACSAAERAATFACGPLGPRGDTRAQLAALNCLTAVAALDPARRAALAERIERGFREAYHDLRARPMMDGEIAEWTELYRLSARFYPRHSTLGSGSDVPITFVNAHHFSVPFWIRRSQETALGTLVHFDTHSDMEGIPRPDDVRRAVENIRAGRDLQKSWHVIAHAVYRNSMPVTGAVLAAGVTEVVWAKPSWARDPVDLLGRALFYARPRELADPRPLAALEAQGPHAVLAAFQGQTADLFQLHYDPADNDGRWLPRRERELETWTVVGAAQRPHAKHFDHLHPIRFSVLTADRPAGATLLPRAISGERFVLDIDLDYFVNTGSEAEVTDDPPSNGERQIQRKDQPETPLDIFHGIHLRAAYLSGERALVERRIERFREVLLALRNAGKKPSIVSIADSANLPFTSYREGQERSDFVPPHHAYWVHERVVAVIREVFGGGPLAASTSEEPAAAPAPKREDPVFEAGSSVATQVLKALRPVLFGAIAWAAAAASTYQKAPHLSGYLLLLHAIATHGPDPDIRRAALEAARLHAGALDPTTLGPPLSPTRADVEESLRRIQFAARYGSTEAEIALAGARWFARTVGLLSEPDIDRDAGPFPPSRALERFGLRRGFASAGEAQLADVLVGLQSTDGGFALGEVAAPDRAAVGLLAVRGLLGLLPTADMPPEDDRPLWEGFPVTRADIDGAVLRGTIFALAHMGETPSTEEAVDGLLLLRTVQQIQGNEAARRLAETAGRQLASRLAPKLPAMVAAASDPEQLAAFAELGLALADFGVNVDRLRADIGTRIAAFPLHQALGTSPGGARNFAEAFKSVSRAFVFEEFGIPGSFFAPALRRALPFTGSATFTSDTGELVDRFNAVSHLLLAASGGRRVTLDRAHFAGEWRFLESVYEEVLAGRRPDMVCALLESRRILGETDASLHYRNLVWQLLHEQNKDGSWGRHEPEDQRLRTTWAAISALADFPPRPPTRLVREALAAARTRAPAKLAGGPATPAGLKPGAVLGARVQGAKRAGRPASLLRARAGRR
jgi:hypothetical protein